ncbi:hypothetical protein D3C87_1305080 [compost metagenome]
MKPEVRFFQSDTRSTPKRMDRMELHARLSDRPVTIVTDLGGTHNWKEQLKGSDIRVVTPYRIKGEQLDGLVLVDMLDAPALLEMHKLVIKQGAEFNVVDMREGR